MSTRIAVLFLLFSTACGLSACSADAPTAPAADDDSDPDPDPTVETRSYRLGVAGLVPRNWPEPSDADWNDLFAKVPQYGELWGVHTGWNEGELDEDGVPVVIEVAHIATSGGTASPYVAVGVEPSGLTQAEADSYFIDHAEAFEAVCVEIARRYRPDIFLIGVEINRFFEKSPEGFEHFLDVYASTYDAVKAESPTTRVGSNFLLEYMRGGGRRSGAEHVPHWELLDAFGGRLDLATFTVYPFLDYDAPSDIPSNYLDAIAEHTDLPIMITETGWPTSPVSDIVASEAAQTAYLETLIEMLEGLPMHALIWAFPHDPEDGQAGGLFDTISMRRNDGSAKPALEVWETLREQPLE